MTLLDRVSIHGFRGARDVELVPPRLCALVGEASGGKSTVLTAIWMLLESGAPVPNASDVTRGATNGRIRLEAFTNQQTFFLDARPPATLNLNREGAPPVVFLPTARRGGDLVSVATHPRAARPVELIGSVPFPAVGELPYLLTLGGYGFYWFRLTRPAEEGPAS